jgi:hypothetical protein
MQHFISIFESSGHLLFNFFLGGAFSRTVIDLQGFFPVARKYCSLQGICNEMSFTRRWRGKIQKLKEIATIYVTYTN